MNEASEERRGDFKAWVWWLGALSNAAFAGAGYGIVAWSGINLLEIQGAFILFLAGFLWSQAICTHAIFRTHERVRDKIFLGVMSFIGVLFLDFLLWLPLFQVLAGVHC